MHLFTFNSIHFVYSLHSVHWVLLDMIKFQKELAQTNHLWIAFVLGNDLCDIYFTFLYPQENLITCLRLIPNKQGETMIAVVKAVVKEAKIPAFLDSLKRHGCKESGGVRLAFFDSFCLSCSLYWAVSLSAAWNAFLAGLFLCAFYHSFPRRLKMQYIHAKLEMN